jgi:hypothetical protein
MAKAKKPEAADGGGTKKQATETKGQAKPPAAQPAEGAAKKATKAPATTAKAAAGDRQPAAGGAATKKKAPAKPAAPGGSGGVPLIDTSLVAETAAKFVMNRALLGNAAAAGGGTVQPDGESQGGAEAGENGESSAVKQLKAGLNKPAAGGLSGLLGNSNVGKKGNTPFGGGNQQVGRNQTFGGDITRSGVPRRTGG